jgi:amino acid efflux transporter
MTDTFTSETSTGRTSGSLTVLEGTALYVGAVLGTGVIALPALAAEAAGPASLLAWAGLAIISIPLATTFAALGARFPDAGGVSTYVRYAFGPQASAVVGWCFYFAIPAGATAGAMFAGAYVASALGGGQSTVMITAAGLMMIVTVANMFGLTVSGRLQLLLATLLVALLLTAVIASAPHARTANLHPFAPHGWLGVTHAAALLVWSFAGWEAITHLAGEFRHPVRDIPRATYTAVAVIGVLYLGVATASVLVLGPVTGTSQAPLAELLALGIGGKVPVLAAFAALLLTLGSMNAYYAGAAKLGAALGRDGALPSWLARGSSAGKVPRRSLAVVSGLAGLALAVTAISGSGPAPLVLLTTGSFVTVYALGTAAALRLLPHGKPRRSALVALVAVLGLLFMTGRYLVWPLMLTGGSLLYLRLARKATASDPKLERAVGSATL